MHTPASEESKQHEEIVSISSFFSLSHTFLYLLDFNFFLLLSMSLLLVELFLVSFFPAVSLLFWPRPFVPLTQSIHFFFWSQRICWLLYIKFFFMISLFLFFLFHSFISFLFSATFPFSLDFTIHYLVCPGQKVFIPMCRKRFSILKRQRHARGRIGKRWIPVRAIIQIHKNEEIHFAEENSSVSLCTLCSTKTRSLANNWTASTQLNAWGHTTEMIHMKSIKTSLYTIIEQLSLGRMRER